MKVGVVVYSETGHTIKVIEQVVAKLEAKHQVMVYRLSYDKSNNVVNGVPCINGYERVIIATPVQGFSPSVAIMEAINRIEDFKGRPVDILITQHFKYRWMGGKSTISALKKAIIARNGVPKIDVDVHWSRKDRALQIEQAVTTFKDEYLA